MGRTAPRPSAADDHAISDTKTDFGHGLLANVSPQMPADLQADKTAEIALVSPRGGLLLHTMLAVFAGMDWRAHPPLGERPSCRFQTSATRGLFGFLV